MSAPTSATKIWGFIGRDPPLGAFRDGSHDLIRPLPPRSTGRSSVPYAIRCRYRRAGPVSMPSQATLYRLVAVMDAGRHTFGEATIRRTQANRPTRPFARTTAGRPGELVMNGY